MTRKPLDLPPDVARAFVKDMRAFFAEEDKHEQDAIAARQLDALLQHQRPREKALRIKIRSIGCSDRLVCIGKKPGNRRSPAMNSPRELGDAGFYGLVPERAVNV